MSAATAQLKYPKTEPIAPPIIKNTTPPKALGGKLLHMKPIESICVFGDSTAWGAWDMDKGGWVNRLWFELAKHKDQQYVELYNCSISGGTTDTILERFENEAKIRRADAIIFQTGGNDAAYTHSPKNFLVSPDKFKANLEEIIKRAQRTTKHFIFMALKNCDETKTTPVPWVDMYYTNENIAHYSSIMQKVCQQHDVPFLDLAPLNNSDFDDGLHPNVSGHEKIFAQVTDFLTKQGWIPHIHGYLP